MVLGKQVINRKAGDSPDIRICQQGGRGFVDFVDSRQSDFNTGSKSSIRCYSSDLCKHQPNMICRHTNDKYQQTKTGSEFAHITTLGGRGLAVRRSDYMTARLARSSSDLCTHAARTNKQTRIQTKIQTKYNKQYKTNLQMI